MVLCLCDGLSFKISRCWILGDADDADDADEGDNNKDSLGMLFSVIFEGINKKFRWKSIKSSN